MVWEPEGIESFKASGFQSIERIHKGSGIEAALKAQNHCQGRRVDILIIDDNDERLFPR
jgi:hypothetical protein